MWRTRSCRCARTSSRATSRSRRRASTATSWPGGPVVVDVLEGYAAFPEKAFSTHVKAFYTLVMELLGKELSGDLRSALIQVLRRVGEVTLGIEGLTTTAASQPDDLLRRDSILSTASAEGGGAGLSNVDVEGGDASTKFMGRRMHSPSTSVARAGMA